MKILIVAQNFQLGGITTALLNMLQALTEKKEHDIELFVFGDGPYFAEIPEEVTVHKGKGLLRLAATPLQKVIESKNPIDISKRLFAMFYVRLVGSDRFYSRQFQKVQLSNGYDVAISYFDDMTSSYFNQGTRLFVSQLKTCERKIAWSHTDPVKSGFDMEHYKRMSSDFDGFVFVSRAMKDKWIEFMGLNENNLHVVHNFMQPEKIKEKGNSYVAFQTEDLFHIVTVARIDNLSKRIDRILETCKLLKERQVRYIWRIVGEGPDMKKCKEFIKKEGLEEYVIMTGFCKNPYPFIKSSQLFVLASDFEGLPTVIREAQILGTPVLSTNLEAVKELITDKVDGFITEKDHQSLCDKIIELMDYKNGMLLQVKNYLNQKIYDNSDSHEEFNELLRRLKIDKREDRSK